jgi:hypothetical protein
MGSGFLTHHPNSPLGQCAKESADLVAAESFMIFLARGPRGPELSVGGLRMGA